MWSAIWRSECIKVQSEKAKVKTAPVSERSKRILSEATTPYLVDEKRAALAEFLARLETEQGKDIVRVILFGSHARGDADEESDVDLLVVAQGDIENARRVYHWCAEIDTPWVSPLVTKRINVSNRPSMSICVGMASSCGIQSRGTPRRARYNWISSKENRACWIMKRS